MERWMNCNIQSMDIGELESFIRDLGKLLCKDASHERRCYGENYAVYHKRNGDIRHHVMCQAHLEHCYPIPWLEFIPLSVLTPDYIIVRRILEE